MNAMAPAAKRRRQARVRARLSLLVYTAAIFLAFFIVLDMVGGP
jgi:hypothetical protein